jgi:NADH-quinone oxidoreductase subunit E
MFQFSKEAVDFVKKELARYESKRSAIIPCLYRAQKENGGWVSPEAIEELSKLMDIPPTQISEVAQFYTMFNKEPVGKYHVQVCCNITCSMNGGRELTNHLCQTFATKVGEISKDGRFTITKVECLGSCDTAPMMQVNDRYYENLNLETAVKILKELK